MKKFLLACTLFAICAAGCSQKSGSTDDQLRTRVDDFMKANDKMDFEKVMDYTYPKLFTLVPRQDMVKFMKETFNGEDMKIEMDSLRVDSLYPVFKHNKGEYAKIMYSMVMIMNLDPKGEGVDQDQLNSVSSGIAGEFGEKNVIVDTVKGIVKVRATSPMVAIKDELSKEWTFINLKKDDPLTSQLLSKDLLDKLATYN